MVSKHNGPLVPLLSVPNGRDGCKTQSGQYSLPGIPPSLPCFLLPSFPHTAPLRFACREDQPHSLISIAGLRNTGPVVDMLVSYPTGADKLLASLSVQSEASQPASQPASLCSSQAAEYKTVLLDMRPSVLSSSEAMMLELTWE